MPTALPAGFAAAEANPEFPQFRDPDRPRFPAARGSDDDSVVVQNFTSGNRSLTVTQGLKAFTQGYELLDRTTVGRYPATVYGAPGSGERCVRWTGDPVGWVEVCGRLDGGAVAMVAVARSIYPTQ